MKLRCSRCSTDIDASGMFPGRTVSCTCGASVTVPMPPSSPSRSLHPFRSMAEVPEPAPSRPASVTAPSRRCPRCKARLPDDLRCVACGGSFLSHTELAALVEEARSAVAEAVPEPAPRAARRLEARVSYLPCPKCREPMRRTNFGTRSGILLDVCRLHGTWLDASEIEEIRAFVRARGGDVDPWPSFSTETTSTEATSGDRVVRESEALLRYHLIAEERDAARTIGLFRHVLRLFTNPWLRGRYRR